MTAIYNVHEAKTQFSQLLERAHRGEEIVVAKAGKAWARLVPLAVPEPRQPGQHPLTVPDSFFDDLTDEELDDWEGR